MFANGPAFRLLPRLDPDNEFFWKSGRDGVLRFLRCGSCGRFVHPPVPRCPFCLSVALSPEPVSGRGTVHSFTVNHQQWIPGSDPYVIGLVAIDEQPDVRLMTNFVECVPDEHLIGTPVEVVFEQNEDVYLPLFRPIIASGARAGARS
ncbi:MAG TPA: OB-fold domain-containing protein [Acidimicrobiales bacterium]|jgi:hypothetical protein|nr:OB-fold domain-containing protein [Acidimicrobiales bacterium]